MSVSEIQRYDGLDFLILLLEGEYSLQQLYIC